MDGPTDSIDDARVATLAPDSPRSGASVLPIPPCQIIFEGFPASEPPRIEVRAWLARLGALTAPMIRGEVAITALDRGRKEARYRVRMELVMPAGPVRVGSDHPANLPHEDVYVAIRNAFRAARRELEARLGAEAPAVPEVAE
jgi:hypothetical protein